MAITENVTLVGAAGAIKGPLSLSSQGARQLHPVTPLTNLSLRPSAPSLPCVIWPYWKEDFVYWFP